VKVMIKLLNLPRNIQNTGITQAITNLVQKNLLVLRRGRGRLPPAPKLNRTQ
jgi:hypothetical protein